MDIYCEENLFVTYQEPERETILEMPLRIMLSTKVNYSVCPEAVFIGEILGVSEVYGVYKGNEEE